MIKDTLKKMYITMNEDSFNAAVEAMRRKIYKGIVVCDIDDFNKAVLDVESEEKNNDELPDDIKQINMEIDEAVAKFDIPEEITETEELTEEQVAEIFLERLEADDIDEIVERKVKAKEDAIRGLDTINPAAAFRQGYGNYEENLEKRLEKYEENLRKHYEKVLERQEKHDKKKEEKEQKKAEKESGK